MVFGSVCFLCLHPYTAHKFEPRSLKCLFLGNAAYKGYRCLCPPTGRIYISRHAIFDEDCFPFTKEFKHLVPQYSTPFLQVWQLASVRKTVDQNRSKQQVDMPTPATSQAAPNAYMPAGHPPEAEIHSPDKAEHEEIVEENEEEQEISEETESV